MKLSTYTFLSTFGELAVSYQALTAISFALVVFTTGTMFLTGSGSVTSATVVGVAEDGIDVMYGDHLGVFIPRDASVYSVGDRIDVTINRSSGYVYERRSMTHVGIAMIALGCLMSLVAGAVFNLVTGDTNLAALGGLYAFLRLVF